VEMHVIFKYRPPGPAAGLPEQDMPTIYVSKANSEEIPDVGGIVALPVEELDLPSSNIKEQQGVSEMRFKVVDRDYAPYTEVAGGGHSTRGITIIVTNFDA